MPKAGHFARPAVMPCDKIRCCVFGINPSETITVANPGASSDQKTGAFVLFSISIRIFAFLFLSATSAAVFAMPYMAG